MRYQIFRLRDNDHPGPPALLNTIASNRALIKDRGNSIFGVFGSLLGLASNEIYLVTFGQQQLQFQLPESIECVTCRTFRPTVRPTDHKPASDPGVYVFRWFSVDPTTIDEIAQLSATAWPDFESSFDTRVQGLFAEDTETPDTMLLITWYRNLTVWEQSRHPPQNARQYFLRRHKLTLSALPIATTLLGVSGSDLVSHS